MILISFEDGCLTPEQLAAEGVSLSRDADGNYLADFAGKDMFHVMADGRVFLAVLFRYPDEVGGGHRWLLGRGVEGGPIRVDTGWYGGHVSAVMADIASRILIPS